MEVDYDIERSCLCSFIMSPADAVNWARKYHVTGDHFVDPMHSTLFDVLLDMVHTGTIVTKQMAWKKLNSECSASRESFDKIIAMKEKEPRHWFELVSKHHVVRRANAVIDESRKKFRNVFAAEENLQGLTENLFQLLSDIKQDEGGIGTIDDMMAVGGYPSAMNFINRVIVNYPKSYPVVLGARPGVGKTTYLCIEAIGHVIRKKGDWYETIPDRHCVLFSLEMPRNDLYRKMICIVSGIDERVVKAGKLNSTDKALFAQYYNLFRKAPIFIYDRAATPSQICSNMRYCSDRFGTTMFGLDYAQRMKAPYGGKKDRQFFCDASNSIADTLKALPSEPMMIILSQLSREADINKHDDLRDRMRKIPRLSHFKETGALEEDAYMAGLLYPNPEYIDKELSKQPVIFAWEKNRGGPTGTCSVIFNKPKQRFASNN